MVFIKFSFEAILRKNYLSEVYLDSDLQTDGSVGNDLDQCKEKEENYYIKTVRHSDHKIFEWSNNIKT